MAPQKPATPAYLKDGFAFIETWLNHLFPLLNQPSLSLAIAHNGKVVYQKAWGYANVAKQEAATPNHIYRVASHSKSFTAFLIAMLVDEGKVKLDEPIGTYLPWLKPNKTYAALTLRQVLSHSTGTARDGEDAAFWSIQAPFPTRPELKSYFLKAKPVKESNTGLKYSNYGYALAGMVIEEVMKKPYNQVMAEKLIKPLGLKHTGTDNPGRGQEICTGYSTQEGGTRYPITPMVAANGLESVTGFHSTPAELVTVFSTFLLGNGHISRSLQKELMHPVWPSNTTDHTAPWYCLGLGKHMHYGTSLYGHSGSYPGFITQTMVCPQSGLAVSICANSLGAGPLPIIKALFDILSFFEEERGAKNPLIQYESPFYSIWGSLYTLAGKGKLVVASLTAQNPLEGSSKLIPLKPGTFKITASTGYDSEDEQATITLKNGKPVSLMYGAYPHTASRQIHLRQLKALAG